MADERFAAGSREALGEAHACRRGGSAPETRVVASMPPERVGAIGERLASSPEAFGTRFRIPAATLDNREQGRRTPDPAARSALLRIERDPGRKERAAAETPAVRP